MTFAQRRNRLTTHFSKQIPVVKRRMPVVVTRLDTFFFPFRLKYQNKYAGLYNVIYSRKFHRPYGRPL